MTKNELRAFHGDQDIKDKYVSRMVAHQEADELLAGEYWRNGKGCAVGCTLHSSIHAAAEEEIGYPAQLMHLEDTIFEGLSDQDIRSDFALRFLTDVTPGADLSMVWHEFAVWLLVDGSHGVVQHADGRGADAIRDVAELHSRALRGDGPSQGEWAAARAAAATHRSAGRATPRAAAAGAAWDRMSKKLLELMGSAS